MPQYRRFIVEGGSFFFTVVTYNRLPILTTVEARKILRSAWIDVRDRFPFRTDAVCLLPNHIHCIWTLPGGDPNYSVRWKEIKRLFTKGYLSQIGPDEPRSESLLLLRTRSDAPASLRLGFTLHVLRDPFA